MGTEVARVRQWPLAELSHNFHQRKCERVGEHSQKRSSTVEGERVREEARAKQKHRGRVETEGGRQSEQDRLEVHVYQNMT